MAQRTFVLGDLHGAARALDQVLDRSGFDLAADRLISLGDICDGWPEVDRCFDRILDLEHLTVVLGNHDVWAARWMRTGEAIIGWHGEGGEGTVASYARRAGREPPSTPKAVRELADTVPAEHIALLRSTRSYLIETGDDGRRRLFTHAGWDPDRPPEEQDEYVLRMGRELWFGAVMREAREGPDTAPLTDFDEVYIGHTPTDGPEPRRVLDVWNLDQGAGWDGVLTLMDVETHEYWQSDPVGELYPDAKGRR